MDVKSSSYYSVDHPEYLYPPSKNPYWTKLKNFPMFVFSDKDTELHTGQWRDCFLDRPSLPARKLHVEIGCNAGHVITEWAKQNPQDAYIGIDWKFKIIFKAAEKAVKNNLKNLIYLRAHAERSTFIFAPGEVDFLYLFFPDPWPKKSHWKHRFMTADRFEQLSKVMKPGGVFHIKTDHRGYFDWILEALERSKDLWEVLELSFDLHKDHPSPETLQIPEVTLFEKLFIKDRLPIHSLKLRYKHSK